MATALALDSNPVGRPPSGRPRAVRIVVYLTPGQLQDLDARVKKLESTRSWEVVDALVGLGIIRP